MSYKENLSGINLNIEAVDVTIDEKTKDIIRKSLGRLNRYYERIEYAQVFLEDKKSKKINQKQVSIRLGILGNDAFASEEGDDFYKLIASVEEKLRRQLEKSRQK